MIWRKYLFKKLQSVNFVPVERGNQYWWEQSDADGQRADENSRTDAGERIREKQCKNRVKPLDKY